MRAARREFLRLAGVGLAATGLYSLRSAAEQVKGFDVGAALDVRTFGAAGDGRKLDTEAVNRAITAAAIGGGRVHFPPGTYLCHSIHLKSKVSLFLAQGATIVAADPPPNPDSSPAYDLAEPNQWDQFQDFGHSHWHNSLLWGEGISDFDISGPGLIWGKGLSRGYGEGPRAEQPGVGNKAISLKNCHNVLLRDISILEGGHFAILATGVDNLTLDNLKIDTNRDGMDIDGCRNVRISNCSVNSPWDDGICLKSSYGLGAARATEDVAITNCFVSGDFQMGTLLDASFKHFAPDFRVPEPDASSSAQNRTPDSRT
jgi:parallel beta-helix repeat protein